MDGHIVWFFPNIPAMQTIHFLLPLNATKAPAKSLAITPRLIKSAKSVFLLATGVEKGAVLASGQTKLKMLETLQLRLVLNTT